MKPLMILLFAAAAFSLPAAGEAAEPLKVVASFSVIGDMAKQVGGDLVSVTTLVGPDSDAHVYEPKPQDAAAVAGADVILINGLGFEGFIGRLTDAGTSKAKPTELTRGVGTIMADAATDPHAFQSVPNARIYVMTIAAAFCAADAGHCPDYKARAEAYDAQLAALDLEIRAAVASIPDGRRTIITSHDAFGYFAHEYGLTFLAPEGVSTESEASASDVARLIDQIRTDKASALFVETISDPRLISQISSETGIKSGGALFSDALSAPDGPASTYIDMMRHNVATIRAAIAGS